MKRIKLDFTEKYDLDLFGKGIIYKLIRLLVNIRLKTDNGWTTNTVAIIDTGSPFSIIPPSIWQNISYQKLVTEKSSLYGFAADEQSPVFGKLVQAQIVFIDQDSVSPIMSLRPFLLTEEVAPIVLGFEDFLTQAKLVCNYPDKAAFLEFK